MLRNNLFYRVSKKISYCQLELIMRERVIKSQRNRDN